MFPAPAKTKEVLPQNRSAARNAKNREKAEKKNNPDYDMVIFDGKITKEDYYEGISHTNKTVSSLQIADFEKFLEEYNSNI